jgi:hypothetical protein
LLKLQGREKPHDIRSGDGRFHPKRLARVGRHVSFLSRTAFGPRVALREFGV